MLECMTWTKSAVKTQEGSDSGNEGTVEGGNNVLRLDEVVPLKKMVRKVCVHDLYYGQPSIKN